MDHFADRLCAALRARGNAVCVGLDPRWESLPKVIRVLIHYYADDGHRASHVYLGEARRLRQDLEAAQ